MARNLKVIEGKYIYLKPVSNEDAEFVVFVRNHQDYSRYLNKSAETVEEQIKWFEKYYDMENEHYFTIVWRNTNKNIGTIDIKDIDWNDKKAEWGKWIVINNPLAAIESMYLLYDYGFNRLNLEKIYFTTVIENVNTAKIHERYKAKKIKLLKDYFYKYEKYYDSYLYEIDKNEFNDNIKKFLRKLIYGDS